MDSQQGLRELALFAGAGGGILGGKLLGWRTVCAVEWEPYAAAVLVARQNEGLLEAFPIWDDVQTFDGTMWRGRVDVVSGGFPCTDISSAGKGAGIDGEASGMWRHMARIIGEVRPKYAFVENSPILTSRGLDRVLGDLAALGYDAQWGVVGAHHVGAPHKRDRIWILCSDSSCESRSAEPQEQFKRPTQFTGSSTDGLEARNDLAYSEVERHREGRRVGDIRQAECRPRGALLSESTESGNGMAYSSEELRNREGRSWAGRDEHSNSGAPMAYSSSEQDNGKRGTGELRRDTMGRKTETPFKDNRAPSDIGAGRLSSASMAHSKSIGRIEGSEIDRGGTKGTGANWVGGSGECGETVADTNGSGSEQDWSEGELRTSWPQQPPENQRGANEGEESERGWWERDPADSDDAIESGLGRLADGIPNRVGMLKCLGNAQVPHAAALAWTILLDRIKGDGGRHK